MNLVNKYWKYAAGAIILILLVSFASKCSHYKKESQDLQALVDFKNQQISQLTNQNGIIVAEQKVAQTNNAADIKKLSADKFALQASAEKKIKQLQAFVTAKQQITLHDTLIEYTDTPAIAKSDSMVRAADVVIPPRPFSKKSEFYRLDGKVLLKGIQLDSAVIYNDVSFRIGEKKKGIFGSQLTVQAINSNPYVRFTGMNSIVLKNRVSAWNRWIKPAVTAIAASLITYKIVK